MSFADIWNIKKELETAISKVMSDAITTLTSQDQQTFQKARARVEIDFILGPGKDRHLAPSEITGLEDDVEDAWSGVVNLGVITAASADIHGQYESYCRYIMATLPSKINNVILKNHVIYGPVEHQGSSPSYKPEESIFKTDMQFGLVVSIHASAWALLNQP